MFFVGPTRVFVEGLTQACTGSEYGITTAWTVRQTTHSLLRLTQFTDKQTDRQTGVCVGLLMATQLPAPDLRSDRHTPTHARTHTRWQAHRQTNKQRDRRSKWSRNNSDVVWRSDYEIIPSESTNIGDQSAKLTHTHTHNAAVGLHTRQTDRHKDGFIFGRWCERRVNDFKK